MTMNAFVTVRCTGGPLKLIDVKIPVGLGEAVPARLTLRHKPHLHQYKYVGKNEQRQHCYEYTHTD